MNYTFVVLFSIFFSLLYFVLSKDCKHFCLYDLFCIKHYFLHSAWPMIMMWLPDWLQQLLFMNILVHVQKYVNMLKQLQETFVLLQHLFYWTLSARLQYNKIISAQYIYYSICFVLFVLRNYVTALCILYFIEQNIKYKQLIVRLWMVGLVDWSQWYYINETSWSRDMIFVIVTVVVLITNIVSLFLHVL